MPFVGGNIYWITFNFIQPIHEKISLCICPERPLFFWINSTPRVHGIGQLLIPMSACSALKYDSYLDLSGVKTGSVLEMQTARDAGPMSADMKTLVVKQLSNPISLLAEIHRTLAIANLT
jgi:hypothetical protein